MSASESSDEDDEKEEATELLSKNEETLDSPVQMSTDGTKHRYGSRDYSHWIWPLSVAFTALLLATIIFASCTTLFLEPSLRSVISKAFGKTETGNHEMLGIELHPQNHVFRSAKTIVHHWTITSGTRSPDGVKKEIYLVNGEFPGPTIECRSGDKLIIHVTNDLRSEEGISIHWHGLAMRDANSMDGAIGFNQCPIPPGGKFTYEFQVSEEQAGTFWWHAHSQVQRGDGMYGGLIVHRPTQADNDMQRYGYKKEVLLLIGDWYHRSAEEILEWYTSARGFGNEPVPDSLLVQGAGRFVCSMAVAARPIDCIDVLDERGLSLLRSGLEGNRIRLRIVNVGSLAGFTLGLDSGTLTPVTVDGGFPISGTAAQSVGILYPGERMDVIMSQDSSSSTQPSRLHILLDPENFKYSNPALMANQSFPIFPESSITFSDGSSFPERDEPRIHYDLSTAISASSPDSAPVIARTADQTILLYARTEKLAIFSNHPKGFMNRTSWSPQSWPLISLPRSDWDENQLIPYIPTPDIPIWVDIIINNLDDGSHPFHLHGHSFYVIASHRSEHGWGSYSPFKNDISPEYNLMNPVKKDTVTVPRRGYVVIRFQADNPGVWMLHCHVLSHLGSGMAMGIQVGGVEGHEEVDAGANGLCV